MGICGASAAMAIAAVIPAQPDDNVKERATIFTVIGVSTLSTAAMVLYPMFVTMLGFDTEQGGLFLGATIHDVAQVVGAGYGMSKDTGDVATIVKLLRVAMLLPVILVITLSYRNQHVAGPAGTPKPPLLPWFVVAFALIVAINSIGLIPAGLQHALQTLSTWLLVIAMSAIGMKSHLKDVATVGLKPILLMVSETAVPGAAGDRDNLHQPMKTPWAKPPPRCGVEPAARVAVSIGCYAISAPGPYRRTSAPKATLRTSGRPSV